MTKNPKALSSGMFLLEFIFSLLFFSLASAICVQIFVHAYTMNQKAKQNDAISTEITNLSAFMHSADSLEDIHLLLQDCYKSLTPVGDAYEVYFDKDWKESATDIVYSMTIDFADTDQFLKCTVIFYQENTREELYRNDFTHYLNRRSTDGTK